MEQIWRQAFDGEELDDMSARLQCSCHLTWENAWERLILLAAAVK
jgi:hypothetical protein